MSKSLARFCGKIAIVTGSTEGIGFAIAQRLAEEGARVIISSRKPANVKKAVNKLCQENLIVKGLTCHVSNEAQRRSLFEAANKWGGLDILVSSAGVSPKIGAILDCSEQVWDKSFNINAKAHFLLAKEALPLLRKSKAGRIIFICSISAFQPFDLLGSYSVSKTALLGLTKAAALQLAVEDITVNSVSPGIIETKFSKILTNELNIEKEALRRIPLARYSYRNDKLLTKFRRFATTIVCGYFRQNKKNSG